jgi:pimeloyl-ACP methyl ester carboxylesterase
MQNTPRTLRQTAALLATAAGVAGAAGAQGTGPAAPDDPGAAPARPTVVLVHGAFADATAWARVIPLLERAGYTVVAVQNPLTGFDADVATTRRVIDAQPGPVVAVGHSYGGAVITQAAAGSDKVRALVYVAAFAPDAGETVGGLWGQHPAPMAQALVTDQGGFLWLDRAKLRDVFARDVPEAETRVMAATRSRSTARRSRPRSPPRPGAAAELVPRRDGGPLDQPRAAAPLRPAAPAARRWRSRRATCRSSRTPAEVARLIEQAAAPATATRPRRSGRVGRRPGEPYR